MKASFKLAAITVATAAAAVSGVALAPGTADAGTVGKYSQPASGAVSITSGTSEINVMIINRKDADSCTVTATRPLGGGKVRTLTRVVKLTALNQYTAIANFPEALNNRTYTVSGTCVGTKAPEATDTPPSDVAEPTEKVTTNLLGGNNKVEVKVNDAVNSNYGQCLQIVKGISWDLGLRGAPLETVMGIATAFCPR
ncbi:hypothetical protein [Gordonia sp. (in: high G+C Gram-positive bacteria)]|uniref:hypothetical protein n=1 Tax=Gordonia sp. (in: high G+C Gram-positive bacteria) TaxID=84139 RepID=UPI003C743EE1